MTAQRFSKAAHTVSCSEHFGEMWRPFCHPCSNVIVMSRYADMGVTYAPLYVHSFRLVQPHTLVEAEKFNTSCTDPAKIDRTADKLR